MVIMFLLGAAATLGAVASIYAAVMHLVDGNHRRAPCAMRRRLCSRCC
jgi:hypothetical protein